MDSYSNYKIRMNKNKSSNDYYNNRYNGDFKTFGVSSDKQYFKGYPYYPTKYIVFIKSREVKRIYLTKLEYLVDAEKWDRYESKYYHLVNPELTPDTRNTRRKNTRNTRRKATRRTKKNTISSRKNP